MYYNIIIARPFDKVFTYKLDDQSLEIGQIVIVPFGKAMEVGMVIETVSYTHLTLPTILLV